MIRARTELSQSKLKPEIDSDPPPEEEERVLWLKRVLKKTALSTSICRARMFLLIMKKKRLRRLLRLRDQRKFFKGKALSGEREKRTLLDFDLSDQRDTSRFKGKYIDSPYSNIDPFLEDGSSSVRFRLIQDMTQRFYITLGVDLMHATEDSMVP